MSDADEQRENAKLHIRRTAVDPATVHALLAIEARLGELVEEQRKANVLAAYEARVIQDDSEFRQARDTVRAVLGLSNTPEGQPE